MAFLYALWMLSVSVAFYVVKIDNLTFLFGAIFDAARWPANVFRGFLRVLFTFVIPLAFLVQNQSIRWQRLGARWYIVVRAQDLNKL